jgi:peptide/nickel transport system substrate-binding protein
MKRRHLLQGAAALAGASGIAAPSLAQPARTTTLRFVPQANLTALDPIWTSAIVTQMHGYHVYDTLYAVDGQQRARRGRQTAARTRPRPPRRWRAL